MRSSAVTPEVITPLEDRMLATTEPIAAEWLDTFWNLNVHATSWKLPNCVRFTWEAITTADSSTKVAVCRSVEDCSTAVYADMSEMKEVFTTNVTTLILACWQVPSWLWKNILLASLAKNSLNMIFGSHDLNLGVDSLHLHHLWHWSHHLWLLLKLHF